MLGCSKERLLAVFDSSACSLQRQSSYSVSHNIFSANNIIKDYTLSLLFKETSISLDKPDTSVKIVSAIGLKVFVTITSEQVKEQQIQRLYVRTIIGAREGPVGASKISRGEWKSIGGRPTVSLVWDKSYAIDVSNVYQDFDEYSELWDGAENGTDCFLSKINYPAQKKNIFFKRQYLGINMFEKTVKKSWSWNWLLFFLEIIYPAQKKSNFF